MRQFGNEMSIISCHLKVQQSVVRSVVDVIFRRVRNMAKSDYELGHVCPSVRTQLGSH